MDLNFELFETAILAMAVLVVVFILQVCELFLVFVFLLAVNYYIGIYAYNYKF